MSKEKIVISFLLVFVCMPFLWTADLELKIQFHEMSVYFPQDSVHLQVSIQNNSGNVYRFRLSDDRIHNIDFDLRRTDNSVVRPSDEFLDLEFNSQRVLYRTVELLPGEELSFIEDLSRYRNLDSGIYVLHARFYPELRGISGQDILVSNQLTLSVREGFRRQDALRIQVEDDRVIEMQNADLAPDEVIQYTLTARMRSEFGKFLQYIDLESLYTSQQGRRDEYTRLSAEDRLAVLETFADDLIANRSEEGIALIPSEYRILETQYNPTRGTVVAEQRYAQTGYTEIKRFTYELERIDGIWYISNYQVVNLGTE